MVALSGDCINLKGYCDCYTCLDLSAARIVCYRWLCWELCWLLQLHKVVLQGDVLSQGWLRLSVRSAKMIRLHFFLLHNDYFYILFCQNCTSLLEDVALHAVYIWIHSDCFVLDSGEKHFSRYVRDTLWKLKSQSTAGVNHRSIEFCGSLSISISQRLLWSLRKSGNQPLLSPLTTLLLFHSYISHFCYF